MIIRDEKPEDIQTIDALTFAAFTDHPHHAPGAAPTEHLVIRRLRESGALELSLVAEDGETIVGHIAFSPVAIAGRASDWYGLGPVSVHPDRQNEGIGGALIRDGLRILRARGANGVVLVGEPGYYARFGFKARPELVLKGVPPEYFLGLPLDDSKIPTGEVTFHEAFK